MDANTKATTINNSSIKKNQQFNNKENNNKKTKCLSRELSSMSIGAIIESPIKNRKFIENSNNIKQKSNSLSSLSLSPSSSTSLSSKSIINGTILNDVRQQTAATTNCCNNTASVTAVGINTAAGGSEAVIPTTASSNSQKISNDLDDPETLQSINSVHNKLNKKSVINNDDDVEETVQQKCQVNLNNNTGVDQLINGCVDVNNEIKSSVRQRPTSYNDFVNLICADEENVDELQSDCKSIRLTIGDNENDDETKTTNNDDDIKPLLFDYENEKKKPKSIVKSPSTKSFGTNNINESLLSQQQSSSSNNNFDNNNERPVLHVQFLQHQNGIPSSSSMFHHHSMGPNGTNKLPGECSSPASSISSTSSSSGSSSSGDDEGSSIGQYSEAKPPDGGWGWVIVFASFIVNLIADGITFSFGVIYVEFLNYFNEGKSKTAWIGSLFMAMPLLSGPIASFLTDRYGCRKVTIAGSILASLGFMLSSQAETMEMLFFTFGILAGFGLSLCYVAAVVIVAYYFDKKRSFATGLSVCGSGIGTFIFAPLTQHLLETYGWRGTTLILSGIFLNMTVCGLLMRDLEWTTHRAKLKAKQRKRSKLGISADSFSVSNSTNTGGTASNLQQQNGDGDGGGCGAGMDDRNHIEPVDPRLFSSLITLPTFMRNGEKVPIEVLELMATHKNINQVLFQNYPGLAHSRSFSEPLSASRHSSGMSPESALSPTNPSSLRMKSEKNRQIQNEQAFVTWLRRDVAQKDARHGTTAYLKDLRMHRHSLTYRGAMLNINRYRLRASSCPDIYRNSMTTIAKEKFQWGEGIADFKTLLMDMLDLSYFADIRFVLFAMSNFLLYTWYDVPYVYLADNAIEMGFTDTDASYLISLIGIVNMFGEIILGWSGDKKFLTPGIIYAICMGLCGIVTALVPLLKTYTGLGIVSGFFGLFIAANYALTSIILVDLITLDRFTNAYGLLLLVQGIANLVGPPLAGWITDVTGNYDLSFYLAGFFIAMSGILMIILPSHEKYKKYRDANRRKIEQKNSISINGDEVQSKVTANNIIKDTGTQKTNGTAILSDCFGKDDTRLNHV